VATPRELELEAWCTADRRGNLQLLVRTTQQRDSLSTLKQIQQAVGEYNFQSQYQQSPVSREGGLIKIAWSDD
jgi:hypothetical protein